jgi:hypothetical protein
MEQLKNTDAPTKPVWRELPQEVQTAWIEQMHAFYPPGTTTLDQVTELAQYEYEQSEAKSLYPPIDVPEDEAAQKCL